MPNHDDPMTTADERLQSWLRTEAVQQGRTFVDPPPPRQMAPAPQVFVSYARADWDDFVAGFVERLRTDRYNVWVDQHLILGGADWMDSINDALEGAAVLILVMTPEALNSRFVKMEYRQFVTADRPLLPVLLKPAKLPAELGIYQHIDFTGDDHDAAYDALRQALDHLLAPPP